MSALLVSDCHFSKAFFNVKVVNSFAQTNWSLESDELYKLHEKQKKDAYMARIFKVEKESCTPHVFTCTGGAGLKAS